MKPPKITNPIVKDYEHRNKNLPLKMPHTASSSRVAYAEVDELRVEAETIIKDKEKGGRRNRYWARPTEFTQPTANRICRQIAEGYSVRGIVSFDPHVPSRATIYRSLKEHPEFRD